MFTIYPAIDLRGGRCVRLLHGKADTETVYFEDPVEAAQKWLAEGTEWLHIVDLDGAFTGSQAHLPLVSEIARLGCKIQIGGGLRSLETVGRVLAAGASRAVLGTSAVEQPALPGECARRFGGEKIAVGLDANDGKIAIRGWVENTKWATLDFAKHLEDSGIGTVIHTDIATDGALTGPNIGRQAELAAATNIGVIASGGVSSIDDVEALHRLSKKHPNLNGVIVGRAIYEGHVTVREMMETTKA